MIHRSSSFTVTQGRIPLVQYTSAQAERSADLVPRCLLLAGQGAFRACSPRTAREITQEVDQDKAEAVTNSLL